VIDVSHRRHALRILVPVMLLLAGWGCTGRDASDPAGAAAGAPGTAGGRGRVVVIGIDGADWSVIRPLVESGRMPAFGRLLREGAAGILHSMEPSASPALWTTIATGVGPERHGIHGFVVPVGKADGGAPAAGPDGADPHAAGEAGDGDGDRRPERSQAVRPVTSSMRRVPALWNILSHYERRVGIVGWLVTWPAEPVDGFIVSSYLPYIYNWSTGRPLKGTIVEGIPGQTFPEGLIERLEPLKLKPAEVDAALVRRFYDPGQVERLSGDDRECVEGFLWSLAADETYRRIGLRLFDDHPVDLFAVYFGGVDVASHRFWKFAWPQAMDYRVGAGEAAVLGRVIQEYYVYVDGMVGEYLERLGPDDTLMVLSDHGFRPVLFPGRPTTSGHHRPEGIMVLWGRGVRRGQTFEGARLVDVLPTLLQLSGVPIARDLEGKALAGALEPGFVAAHPPGFVASYADLGAPVGPDHSDLDRNVLERLRSLGYIGD